MNAITVGLTCVLVIFGTGPPPNTLNADGEPIYDPLKDIELATQKVLSNSGNTRALLWQLCHVIKGSR